MLRVQDVRVHYSRFNLMASGNSVIEYEVDFHSLQFEAFFRTRNHENQDNPAGPLFAAGEFAEADIVNATPFITCGTACSGSVGHPCC
jgi:hypothetical protein